MVIEKYKDVMLSFDSYHKYVFTFKGMAPDGARIICKFGGDHDIIYRYSVDTSTTPLEGDWKWHEIIIYSPEGNTFKYDDW